MIELILLIAVVGTMGEGTDDSDNPVILPELKNQIQVVINAAEYYLHEGAPSITKLFIVDNPDTIVRLEGKLKERILEDLLSQLVDVWAQMNVRVLKGYKVLKSLRDEAERLIKELKVQGLKDVLDSDDIKQRIAERVKQLLNNAKGVFCVQTGNLTGLELAEQQLFNLTSNLEYHNVKIHLLKMVYSYKLEILMNSSVPHTEHTLLKETWEMVSAWGKWTVLDLMAFIKEPLNDLYEEVQKYVTKLVDDMDDTVAETLENVLELVIATTDESHNEELLKLFNTLAEVDNPLYILCN